MPGALDSGIVMGFAGKIPARGDFVQAGLPRDFTGPWHDWQASVIAGSRALMNDTWLDAFLEAPVWRFVLPAGLCGAHAAIGLLMPSVDKIGRYFPLTFAALFVVGTPDPAAWSAWLDAVEELGRQALDEDAPPDRLTPPAGPVSFGYSDATEGSWWTDGGPRVAATGFSLPLLPDAARFASMLGHLAPRETAS